MDISPIRVVRAQCCACIPQLRWCARNGRHILQQRCQGGEHRNVNIGSGANTPGRAGRPIEHPGRNLQPSPGCPTREAATENLYASLLNHLMNMDQASCPRMPRIKKLVLRDPVGVPSSCCITTGVPIRVLTAARRIKPTSPRCHSAWQPNPGRGSTYRRGNSVQTTGTSSVFAFSPSATDLNGTPKRIAIL